jgi:Flp pilus assembly protein TadD
MHSMSLIRPSIDYLHLRQIQNRDWALHHVAEGIDHAQKDEFGEALKKYHAALELDPECVEALVARGAAYVYYYVLIFD